MDVSVRQLRHLLAAIVLLAGCQGPNTSIELLESELRWMEDQLYALDRQLDQTCLQLASAQNSNRALHRELARVQQATPADEPTPATPPVGGGRPSAAESLVPPGVEVPDAEDLDERDLQVPRVDLGPSADPLPFPSTSPDPAAPSPADSRPRLDPDLDQNGLDSAQHSTATPVARIAVNRHLTGGYDFDGRPGDEGVLVVVEPLDATGQYIAVPGDLVIEVRDPDRPGPVARVARWEFDRQETAGLFQRSLLGRGVHLKLPWPGAPPDTERLLLSVHYRQPTGEVLLSERPIHIDLGPHAGNTPPLEAVARPQPNPLVPAATPQLNQLFPAHAMAMPTGPLGESERARPASIARGTSATDPRAATRLAPRPSAGRTSIEWSPYR